MFDRSMAPMIVLWRCSTPAGSWRSRRSSTNTKSVMFVGISDLYGADGDLLRRGRREATPCAACGSIRSGYAAAGVGAAALGVLGYFNVAGLGSAVHPLRQRSAPPVRSRTPTCSARSSCRRSSGSRRICCSGAPPPARRAALAIAMMTLGVLLSFSRGAWGDYAGSIGLLIVLTLLTTNSPRLRRRVAALAIAGVICVLASRSRSRCQFPQSATCSSSARLWSRTTTSERRAGSATKFARCRSCSIAFRLRSPAVPQLLHRQDPHETYLNAFASYGWIGGLSYLAFTAADAVRRLAAGLAKRAVPKRGDRGLVVLVRTDSSGPSDRHRPLASSVPAIRPHFRTCRRRSGRPAQSCGRRRRSPTNAGRPSRGPFAQGWAARRSLGGDGVGVAREPAPVARLGQCAQSVVGLPQAGQMSKIAVPPERRA